MSVKKWLGVSVVATGLLLSTVGCAPGDDEPSEPTIEDDATPGVDDEGTVTAETPETEEETDVDTGDDASDDAYDVDVDL